MLQEIIKLSYVSIYELIVLGNKLIFFKKKKIEKKNQITCFRKKKLSIKKQNENPDFAWDCRIEVMHQNRSGKVA